MICSLWVEQKIVLDNKNLITQSTATIEELNIQLFSS